jgi:hypothetical protein
VAEIQASGTLSDAHQKLLRGAVEALAKTVGETKDLSAPKENLPK